MKAELDLAVGFEEPLVDVDFFLNIADFSMNIADLVFDIGGGFVVFGAEAISFGYEAVNVRSLSRKALLKLGERILNLLSGISCEVLVIGELPQGVFVDFDC